MTLQTANGLMLIRCYTKYLIEIENESALLEQMNFKPSINVASDSSSKLVN